MSSTREHSAPFAFGWWSFDLGTYRPCGSTYCLYPYDSLPPIRELRGTLDWLSPLDSQTDERMQPYRNSSESRRRLTELENEVSKLGLSLPNAFVHLMSASKLQDQIPSCTACTFDLSAHVVPCIGESSGYLIRFLRDQQDVFLWYLYLTPDGDECVLVSAYEFGDEADYNPNDLPDDQVSAVISHTWICAPTFETFVYRFWLENTLWFKLNSARNQALTDVEQRYLDHYDLSNGT
jgi:hypothetical protein